MIRRLSGALTCILVFCSTVNLRAQQAVTLSQRELAVKHKLEQLQPGAHISVVRLHAPEQFGNFVSSQQDVFTFYDVGQKKNVVLGYGEVKKIKDGYGGYNSIRHKHVDPTKRLVGVVVGAGVLFGLIVAVVVSR